MREAIGCVCLAPEDSLFFHRLFDRVTRYRHVLLSYGAGSSLEGEYALYVVRCAKALQLYRDIPLLADLCQRPLLVLVDDIRFRLVSLERNERLWYAGCDDPEFRLEERITALIQGRDAVLEREQVYLTPREQEVCQLLMTGFSVKEVAQHLGITVATVNAHKKQLFAKFKVHSTPQMVSSGKAALYHIC